jgi:hypothetical protein
MSLAVMKERPKIVDLAFDFPSSTNLAKRRP